MQGISMSETEKDTTPTGFMTYAESYGRAAFMVVERVDAGDISRFPCR